MSMTSTTVDHLFCSILVDFFCQLLGLFSLMSAFRELAQPFLSFALNQIRWFFALWQSMAMAEPLRVEM